MHAMPENRDIVRRKSHSVLHLQQVFTTPTGGRPCAEEKRVSQRGQTVLAFMEFATHFIIMLASADVFFRKSHK